MWAVEAERCQTVDVGAEGMAAFVDAVATPVEVMDALDPRFAFGRERGGAPEVTGKRDFGVRTATNWTFR